MLGCGNAINNLSNDVSERANIVFGRGDLDMIRPQKWAFRDLAQMNGRSNMDARVGLKSDQLPPE